MASQRWATGTFLMHNGKLYKSRHNAMPFGFSGSVYAWERFANFLWTVVVMLLRVPLGKYVDDFFGIEHEDHVAKALEFVASSQEPVSLEREVEDLPMERPPCLEGSCDEASRDQGCCNSRCRRLQPRH